MAVAKALGMDGIPFYYAADWDATPADQAAINAYMDGVISVHGLARAGIYGGYYVVRRTLDAGKAAFSCQTRAWSGGQWDHRANIRQGPSVTVGGASCDADESLTADYGQWPRPREAPVTTQPPVPPGQWKNPDEWTWKDAYQAGIGLDGKFHLFHLENGHWVKVR